MNAIKLKFKAGEVIIAAKFWPCFEEARTRGILTMEKGTIPASQRGAFPTLKKIIAILNGEEVPKQSMTFTPGKWDDEEVPLLRPFRNSKERADSARAFILECLLVHGEVRLSDLRKIFGLKDSTLRRHVLSNVRTLRKRGFSIKRGKGKYTVIQEGKSKRE